MAGATCELCGQANQLWAAEIHHIVPKELTSEAELPDSATVKLCPNCYQELVDWYARRVFDMTYDSGLKRFRPRSLAEMVKEYEAAYRVFAQHKEGQRKRA